MTQDSKQDHPRQSPEFDMTWEFSIRPQPQPISRNLSHWNAYRAARWEAVRNRVQHPEKYLNGLACPECEHYLYDTGRVLSLAPNKFQVKCTNCQFKGERYE